jgi:tetratricopeptide (TPR) repeat protein
MYKFSVPRPFRSSRTSLSALLVSSLLVSSLLVGASLSCALLTTTVASAQEVKADAKAAPKPDAKAPPEVKAEAKSTKAAAPADKKDPKATAPDGKVGEAATSEEAEEATPPTDAELATAKAAFEEGTKAYEADEFDKALELFKKAYETVPSPHAEYWVAKAMDDADAENENAKETVDAYAKFLSNPGATHAGADRVSDAEARIVELK